MLSPDFWFYAKVSASVAWENWIHIMKPMIFHNQEKSAYVATISKSLHIHYTNEVRPEQKKAEVGSLVRGKESHFKRRFGSVVCGLMV